MAASGQRLPLRADSMTSSLCETCMSMREVRTPRSQFLLCQLSVTNSAFRKYPPQPVVRCDGYQLCDEAEEEASGDST